jgi:GABA permease
MPELSRSLQPRHITMISIGGMIGAGLFVSSSAAIAATGPAIVLSYLITGTLVLLVMRMLGEMVVAQPAVRSFTEFARAGLGPWAGFVAGWLYWYFWMIVVPVEAIAGANILHQWLGLPPWLLGVLLMAVMTCVNLMSARSYGEFEFWFASIKVAAILVFIALAAAFAIGFTSPSGPTFGNLTANGGFMPKGWVSVLAGAVTVYFSLTGAEITTIAAAESKEPARAVARMSTSVVVRILTFYVGSVFLIVSVVPWVRVRVGESPFTLALTTMQFKWASLAMSAIILTAVLSCLNSAFYVCSRVGILAAITSNQTVFAFLVNASGALIVFVYMIIAFAQIRLRREREASGAPAPALSMWLFPWASYAAIAGMAAVLIAMAFTPGEMSSELWSSVLTLVLAGVAFLAVDARRRSRATRAGTAASRAGG